MHRHDASVLGASLIPAWLVFTLELSLCALHVANDFLALCPCRCRSWPACARCAAAISCTLPRKLGSMFRAACTPRGSVRTPVRTLKVWQSSYAVAAPVQHLLCSVHILESIVCVVHICCTEGGVDVQSSRSTSTRSACGAQTGEWQHIGS